MKRAIELLVIISLILGVSLLLTFASELLVPSKDIRLLALFYLFTAFNPRIEYYTVSSPESLLL